MPNVIVGLAIMVTLMALLELLQPEVLFRTLNVALYVPAVAAPGTVITIGLAVNEALTTSIKPAASAAALKSILT